VYASEEAHNSVDKAVALLGIGLDGLRRIPVDADFRIDLGALERAIAADREADVRPICVIGAAGTVNTGAIDDLERLADLCRREDLWLHVDGAFGALAALSPALRPLVRGVERADSLAFDFHKWFYMPIEVGCVLVRDAEAHRRTFSPPASYLASLDRGIASGPPPFAYYGPQLTRGFRALKVWISLKAYGVDKYARLIEQNVRQARRLESLVERDSRLELLAPVPLNVVCFRYVADGLDGGGLDGLNREILMRLQERGIAVPSSTVVRGSFAIRCAFTNHRTRRGDIDRLVESVVALGEEIVGRGTGGETASGRI
jgi:aromatic-L-amino-acid decarboxylase